MSASLYVGDLHQEVTEALLGDLFNAVGPVASIRVCRDAVTRRSLGYAYVNFHAQQDAERALDTMNYTPIKGRPCRMMWSQRDPSLRKTGQGNVFVKNLDLSIDNKALYDTFSLFGNILSCKVVTEKSGKSKGYGFVHFETLEAADEAIRKINGMLIANKEVYVGHFMKRTERGTDWTNIFVKNVPLSWDQDRFETEFGAFGPVGSCVVMVDADGKSRGFGFVDYVEHEAAVKAIEEMHEKEVDDETLLEGEVVEAPAEGEEVEKAAEKEAEKEPEKEAEKEGEAAEKEEGAEAAEGDKPTEESEKPAEEGEKKSTTPGKRKLYVSRAMKKKEREQSLQRKFEQLKVERLNKFQGTNLFVKNLDEAVDEDTLRTEFDPYGTITSIRVMRDTDRKPKEGAEKKANGVSRGFGFVCFSSPEEATKAVTEMNGKMLLGKPMFVALAVRKEVRRAQIEAQQQQRAMNARGGMPMQPAMYPGAPMFYAQGGMPPQARQNFAYLPQQMGGPRGVMPMGGPRGGMPFPRGYPMQGPGGPGGYGGPMQGNPNAMGMGMGPGGPQQGGNQRGGNRNNRGRNQQGRQGGQRGNRQGPGGQMMGQPNGAMMQQANFKYNSQVRNMPGSMQPMPMQQMPQMPQQPPQPNQAGNVPEPLTAAALANASEDQQKNMIGERLYPLIHAAKPDLAGKITGMLLEMDNPELLHLLESPDALQAKITEALQVLEAHQAQQTQD